MIGTTRPLVGTDVLLKATLRHELKRFIPWIAIVTMLSTSSILAYAWMFPHREDRAVLDATIGGNPALGLIFGPARNLYTNEGFNTWRTFALGGFLTGIAAIFAVTKATRGARGFWASRITCLRGYGTRRPTGRGRAARNHRVNADWSGNGSAHAPLRSRS